MVVHSYSLAEGVSLKCTENWWTKEIALASPPCNLVSLPSPKSSLFIPLEGCCPHLALSSAGKEQVMGSSPGEHCRACSPPAVHVLTDQSQPQGEMLF